jgi:SAM-dependent methyltransferase
MKELLLGCGSRTRKDLYIEGRKDFENVTRLEINADHNPDVVWDLRNHPLPFADNEFDEIHAYEVLEHLAQQGDYEFFFREFTEYWRILKPGGFFMASCPAPSSVWAFGDPSHKRIISKETLVFLSQAQYRAQIGKTSMSDFRYLYKVDFQTVYAEEKNGTTYFILKKC